MTLAEPLEKPRRTRWILPLKVLVSACVLAYLVSHIDFHLLAGLSWKLPMMLAAGCLINLVALAIMASRWQVLVHAATGQRLPLRRLFGYYLVGAFYNNLLPGAIGGDFIRIKRLVGRHDLPWGLATRITLVERLLGLSDIVLFVSCTLPFARLPPGWRQAIPDTLFVVAAGAGVLCFAAANIWLCRSLKGSRMSAAAIAATSGLVILGQASDMCTLALFLFMLGTPLDPVNLMFSVSLAYLAAVLPISLGGLGVREGALTAMLGLNGIPVATAALLAVLLLCGRLATAAIGVVADTRDSR